jgi:voltage-gated potassium channel
MLRRSGRTPVLVRCGEAPVTSKGRDKTGAESGPRAKRRSGGRPVKLRVAHSPRIGNYFRGVLTQTYFLRFVALLVVLWLAFAAGLYLSERGFMASPISSYGRALYWGIAAFSTAGIADTPHSAVGQLLGGIWIVIGSTIFFGIIIATVTSYFMRPMQSPVNQIVDTIEYNLEHLDDLSIDELKLLKQTTDALILHTERMKSARAGEGD